MEKSEKMQALQENLLKIIEKKIKKKCNNKDLQHKMIFEKFIGIEIRDVILKNHHIENNASLTHLVYNTLINFNQKACEEMKMDKIFIHQCVVKATDFIKSNTK